VNLLTPYLLWIKLAAAAALIVGLFAFGHHQGAKSVQGKWDSAKAAQLTAENSAILQRTSDNTALAAAQAETTALLKKGYSNEITRITVNRAAAGRLRIPAAACTGLAITAKADRPEGGYADATGAGLLPIEIDQNLRALMLEADTIVAGCRAGQGFITANGMAP
jgi:hypothetical protein